MPESIDQYFAQSYQNTIRILSQQKKSVLEETTLPPINIQGENLYFERLGATYAIKLATRHADTPNIEPDHSRRRVSAEAYVWSTLLDRYDDVRTLASPINPYNQNAKMAMLRAKDEAIIAALGGSAFSGKTGSTEVVFPASQRIASGSVGLTIGKLLAARRILKRQSVSTDMEWYLAISEQQLQDMLNTTEATHADYNSVKALVRGELETFLGFKFLCTELLVHDGTNRLCYAFAKGAIGLGVLEEITTRIDQRIDKNYAWQPYVSMDIGATRVEDAAVVQILCAETL